MDLGSLPTPMLILLIFLGTLCFYVVKAIVWRKIVRRASSYSEWVKEVDDWEKKHPVLRIFYWAPFPFNLFSLIDKPPEIYKNEVPVVEEVPELEIPPLFTQSKDENNDNLLSAFNESIQQNE
tara:strand:+ start:594 stop:962 length:369 start_codon:yes stop_codon:yes gene_type:complete